MTWGALRKSRWGTALLCLAISSLALPADAGTKVQARKSTVDFTGNAAGPVTMTRSTAPQYAFETTGGGMTVAFPMLSTEADVVVNGNDRAPLSFAAAGLETRDDDGRVLSSTEPSTALAFAPSSRSVTYVGAYEGVNDVYAAKPGRLKHDVVLLRAPALGSNAAWFGASYRLGLPSDYALRTTSVPSHLCRASITVCDEWIADGSMTVEDSMGDAHYVLGAIVVIDANGQRTQGRYRIIADDGREQRISLEVSADWLRSAAYPVTIDPTVDITIGTINNSIPFGSQWNNPASAMQTLYTPAQVGTTGTITRIAVQTGSTSATATYPRVEILIGETTLTGATFTNNYANNYDAAAPVVVYDAAFVKPATTADDWVEFDLTTPYVYTGANSLVVEYRIYGQPTPTGEAFGMHRGDNADNTRLYTTSATLGATGTLGVGIGYNIRIGFTDARINEIRTDDPGADTEEYIELTGTPGEPLDGLYLVVIGDDSGGSSGVIEEITSLTGVFDANGFFVVAESGFTLGTADQTATLTFENSDNLTFLIVTGLSSTGTGQDLDTDDDGVLDTIPWTSIVDSVSLVETVGSGEQIYSTTTVGPDGSAVPWHVRRCPDATGAYVIGQQDPVGGSDTPGAANDCPVCGNGLVEDGEDCDGDGAGTGGETAACDTDCTFQSCGDGIVNTTALETCDGDGAGTGGETATCDTDCTVAVCGDGVINTTFGDVCDGDGAGTGGETAACDTDCTLQSCGDGIVNTTALETCDGDGAGTGGETADCDTDCTAQSCGDGVINTTALETCDGDGAGTGGETADCDTDCTAQSCGDGVINTTALETCDGDGAGTGGETADCDTDCTAQSCGDGVINTTALETCDGDGAGTGGETVDCDTDCTAQQCGDGVINTTALETCDGDGAGTGGETATCDSDCTAATCGDGTINNTAGETCEGGKTVDCDSDCTAVTCGDGHVNATAGEMCDGDGAGTGGETATCDTDCTTATCGDTVVNAAAGEACDDGAESATCNADCTASSCGDGVANTAAGEACDDGAESAGCNADCTASVCGDSTLNATAGETCDDGNTDDGDGCSATCIIEEPAESGGGCCDSGGGGNELPGAFMLFLAFAFSMRRRRRTAK